MACFTKTTSWLDDSYSTTTQRDRVQGQGNTTLPHPMDAEVDYDGSGDDALAEPASHSVDLALPTPSASSEQTTEAPAEMLAGLVPAAYPAGTGPVPWVALPPTIRGDMITKAPLTVQNVHVMDEEARMLEQRLEDDASREAITAATSSRAPSRTRTATLEATNAKLHQQLAAVDRALAQALSCTESSDRALAAAAASRRRPRQTGPAPRRETLSSSPDRDCSSPSPRSPRHVLLPSCKCRHVDYACMHTSAWTTSPHLSTTTSAPPASTTSGRLPKHFWTPSSPSRGQPSGCCSAISTRHPRLRS